MTFLLQLLISTAMAVTYVQPDRNIAAYSATSIHFVPGATPTDLCVISGSATKTVEVTSLEIAAQQTSAGTNQFHFIKRSTANSGGTPVSMSAISFDSGKPAATASAVYYSSNPSSLGTAVGTLFVKRVLTGVSTSILNPVIEVLHPQGQLYQPVILRGTAQSLAVNFAGVALPSGMTVSCTFRWIER